MAVEIPESFEWPYEPGVDPRSTSRADPVLSAAWEWIRKAELAYAGASYTPRESSFFVCGDEDVAKPEPEETTIVLQKDYDRYRAYEQLCPLLLDVAKKLASLASNRDLARLRVLEVLSDAFDGRHPFR